MARFKVNDIFMLSNEGQFLEGETVEGDIVPGNLIRLLINNDALSIKINAVEYIGQKGKRKEIGLVVGPFEEAFRNQLGVIKGRTVSVI